MMFPIHLPQSVIPAIRNTMPDTFPPESIDPALPPFGVVRIPIPQTYWQGDWVVDIENDIKWLNDKFNVGVGDYLWVREPHQYLLGENDSVICVYPDLEKRYVGLKHEDVRFPERKMPPVCMRKQASRYVLKIHDIDTVWNENKTQLMWDIKVSRVGDFSQLLKE
jgi:hypothetical protein